MTARAMLALLLLLASASAAGADLAGCINRCNAKFPTPTATPAASPIPTRTPGPTPTPLPCEPIGGRKDYVNGQERMFCFDAGTKRALMEVSVKSQPSCGGELEAQLQAPSGARHYSLGPQPNTILPWEPGRWYLWTRQSWGNCSPFTFTPR